MAVGYATQLLVFRLWERNILEHYSRGGVAAALPDAEAVRWAMLQPFVRNFIIESIGFVSMLTSLVAIEIISRQRRDKGQCAQRQVTKIMTGLIVGVLVLNPLLRLGLDAATCCVPSSCSLYPSNDGTFTLASPPEINLPLVASRGGNIDKPRQCVDKFDPCDFQDARAVNATIAAINYSAPVRPLPGVNTSTLEERRDSCRRVHEQFGYLDSKVALHGIALGRIGRRWCVKHVGSGTANETVAVRICRLKPSWGRGVDFGKEDRDAAGGGGVLLVVVLQLFFGRFSLFAYGAPSLIGVAIGVYMQRTKPRDHPVLPRRCVRQSLLACFGSLLLGALLFAWLVVSRAEDAALQAGTHARLFCGAGEVALVILSLCLVDASHDDGRFRQCRARCLWLRRFGVMTLTLWTLQWLNLVAVIAFDEIGAGHRLGGREQTGPQLMNSIFFWCLPWCSRFGIC